MTQLSSGRAGTEGTAGRPGTEELDSEETEDRPLTDFELVREGARRDGVEILYYEPRFPVPGTRPEKRITRTILACLSGTGIFSLAFLGVYLFWPYSWRPGTSLHLLYTPLLGITLALALILLGLAIVIWVRKLLPAEVSVQDRHDGASPDDERKLTGATMLSALDATGIKRRPMLKGALAVAAAPLGLAVGVGFIGGLITKPGDKLVKTAWRPNMRMVRLDGSGVRPTDIDPGGIETVFPDVPGGSTNQHADSPVLLLHLRDDAARKVIKAKGFEDANYLNFYAYSKICTHLGCPASLYEQQTNIILCPCHQSQFDVLDHCEPIFGPATRRLPQLPIRLDNDGYLVAKSDFRSPIGPGFWEEDNG